MIYTEGSEASQRRSKNVLTEVFKILKSQFKFTESVEILVKKKLWIKYYKKLQNDKKAYLKGLISLTTGPNKPIYRVFDKDA